VKDVLCNVDCGAHASDVTSCDVVMQEGGAGVVFPAEFEVLALLAGEVRSREGGEGAQAGSGGGAGGVRAGCSPAPSPQFETIE
jgi:hypothetical protein